MTKTIAFKEPARFDYLYIDKNNKIHLMLPIVGGEEIGLDNTCMASMELKIFFHGYQADKSAEDQLLDYKKYLEDDIADIKKQKGISRYAYHDLMKEKIQRLEQINKYIVLIGEVKNNYDRDISQLQDSGIPELPSSIHKIIKSAKNAFAVRLAPLTPDPFTRLEDPIFSIKRNRSAFNLFGSAVLSSGLGTRLRSAFLPEDGTSLLSDRKSAKEQIIETVMNAFEHKDMNVPPEEQALRLDQLKKLILKEIRKVDETIESMDKDHYGFDIDLNYLESMGIDKDASIKDWINTLIVSKVQEGIWDNPAIQQKFLGETNTSVFYDSSDKVTSREQLAQRMAIRVQYLLAEINIYCRKYDLSKNNFGRFFDKDPYATEIGNLVKQGIVANAPNIEQIVYNYVNQHHRDLGLQAPLSETQQAEITDKFTQHYTVIKESPHFDEFLVMDTGIKGNVFSHLSRISCHFLDFFKLQTRGKYSLGDFETYSEALKSENPTRLNHINEIVSEGYERIGKFREEVMKLLSENKPKELVAYLIEKSSSGTPNYSMLSLETQTYISYNRNWPNIAAEISMSASILPEEQEDLIKLLSRSNVNREHLSAITWSKHSDKPLLELELNKVADGLLQTVNIYNAQRSWQWYKGSRNDLRITQCDELVKVAQEINSLLNSKSKNEVLEKLLQSIATLERIDREISAESNWFRSSLQKEVQSFTNKLKRMCELDEYSFRSLKSGELISFEMDEQLNKIANLEVREIVSNLPAHYHTDEAISFFNTLTIEETAKVASYLNIEYREVDSNTDKNTLFTQDIPGLFKEVNLQLLNELMESNSISPPVYEKLSQLADKIPPEFLTIKNIQVWSKDIDTLDEANFNEVAKVKKIHFASKVTFFGGADEEENKRTPPTVPLDIDSAQP
ncbi:protein SdcA [Legionella maioricensis]|uniref:Protein SdcA n=1 Tax=Legionella maioricensis TaxID=2896528 RepID=A0A9X2ICW1_9GAMM|nr:protein SdcA [Legionella maioricensis]MCL9684892.1 protein SdcA [Legionella maioricensis]MCL9689289.1 protein SdcA [Legionella maioricensis]